jgi:putative serine protease PepD
MAHDETPQQRDDAAEQPDAPRPESGEPLAAGEQSHPDTAVPAEPASAQPAESGAQPAERAAEPAEPPGGAAAQPAESGAQPADGGAQPDEPPVSPWARPSAPSAEQVTSPIPSVGAPATPGTPPAQPYPGLPPYPAYPSAHGQPTVPTVPGPPPAGQLPPPAGQLPPPAGPGPSQPGGGFRLFSEPTVRQPQPDAGQRTSVRRKLLIGGVALALVAALVGGGLGGMLGYQFAASGGHLSVLDAPLPDVDSAAAPQGAVEQVAQRTLPTVVQLRVTSGHQAGAGSGMVLSPDGLILTNNHVVEMAAGGAGQLTVLFQDGKIAPGKIIGRDPTSDIAVVKAQNVSGLQPITLGNSDSVRVGESVIAFGSPLGLGGTVTTGIVSALNRAVSVGGDDGGPNGPPGLDPNGGLPNPLFPNPPLPSQPQVDQSEVLDAIQTDAAINPGNSGGPLVDIDGRVIGINTAIASIGGSGDQSGSVGLGFSVPINQAKRIAEELEQTGHATKAVLGVTVPIGSRLAPLGDTPGAKVQSVAPGSAADKAGVKAGDVIVKVDQRPITYGDELVAAVRSHAPGEIVTLTLSDGRTMQVVLAGAPSN